MSMHKAKEIAAAYEQRQELFSWQHDELLKLFKGTPLAKDMEAIKETVGAAWELNLQAGWLSEYGPFKELDYFLLIIRQDYRGRLVKSKADIPASLKSEFDDLDEAGFANYMSELRKECCDAYGEMRGLRGDLRHKLVAEHFLDILCCLPEVSLCESEIRDVEPFFDNLSVLWDDYEENAKSLMCMANELGNYDYDPSLMEALLFD